VIDDKTYLQDLANVFATADREGLDEDIPEGRRWIQFSDTLAMEIAARLTAIAERMA
jgi:hypothetical protein